MFFRPAIFDTFKGEYHLSFLKRDFFSGLTVAIVAIPLSIAFAIASGATPIVGIFTAIIGGLVVSFLGGSKYNISGPAGAFIGVIYGIIANYGYSGLIISTFIAGLLIILFSILNCGKLIKYIPNCVIIGFGIGLGIDIMSGQIADFLGIHIHGCENFIKKISACMENINQTNFSSLFLGTLTIILVAIIRKIRPSLPVFLIAIIISCIVSQIFHFQVETISSRFGTMHLAIPDINKEIFEEFTHPFHLLQFFFPSLAIAILASIEALLAATIADKMRNDTHNSNTELFSLGIGNCISALFGCLPIAGTTARTIVNAKSGAKSSLAGVFHAVFLIVLMALFAEIISTVNMPTIAGILFVVSFDMIAYKKVIAVCKNEDKISICIMLFTAICVLVFGIVFAIIFNTIIYQIIRILRLKNKI